ncbi:MAG: putative DNA modification/repair radical SAM protein [Treponema sp.]|nr:putative DNA modification/repair radical SAM protein [Treponema sp.]
MDLGEKLSILSASAKYDASCSSSGSSSSGGVCHSWTEDGRCITLLKVLFSNFCRFDCAYCVNRASAESQRAAFTVDELVELTCQFYRRNYIEGLFLSSGVFADPDIVMEKLIECARKLRRQAGFGGYIHMKLIPGATEKMIREAGLWADRLSANIELPTDKSLQDLAPQKSGKKILGTMGEIFRAGAENEEDKRKFRQGGRNTVPAFAPAGQSTQLIVGASPENDKTILNLTGALYRKFELRRVYYSAYIPVGLPEITVSPRALLLREHRLYQADWLLRFYRFSPEEVLEDDEDHLDMAIDPKTAWALRHLDFFPLEVNRAGYDELLRVPGIGAKAGRRIIEARRRTTLNFDNLRRIGVVLKRARHFISAAGSFLDRPDDPGRIRRLLSDKDSLQPLLFEF